MRGGLERAQVLLPYTPYPLMSNGMCFTAQPDREEGDEGLLSRCLLHMRWRFVSRPSFPRNTPASCIHCCYPASPNPHPHHLSHSFSPDPHGISHHFCTYYLPLPDQTARFSSDGFNFSESRLSKTNILAYDSQDQSLMSKCPTPKKNPENIVLPYFFTAVFL